jgi:hypothetical protein
VHLTCTHLWQSSHDTALLVEIITHILHTDILVAMIFFLYAWEWVGDEHRRFSANCHHWASVVRPLTFHILINSSEATGPIWTKLWWNGPWMAPF